jgi:hypothetical protein
MDNILEDDSMLELQIDQSSIDSLENGSWWARFIGIVAIVIIGVVLCALGFYLRPLMAQFEYRFGFSGVTAVLWAIVAIIAIVTGIFIALLMSFATKTNRAVKEMNQDLLEKGISSLKVYFIVAAVFAMLTLVLSFIGVFATLINN